MNAPSIQSFYQREGPSSPFNSQPDDCGFPSRDNASSKGEIKESSLRPLTQPWKPKGEYRQTTIAELQPGPGKVRFTARIVNFSASKDRPVRSMLPQGFHFLIVRDDTGAVAVKLLSTGVDYEYLRFGALVTVWTAFVSEYSAAYTIRVPSVSMMIPVHPAQGSASCIKFHQETPGSMEVHLCRSPPDYNPRTPTLPMPGLMSLQSFLNLKHETSPEARILICVSSVGPRRTVRSRKTQTDLDFIEVRVFDETANCVLKLWDEKVSSARAWTPNQTILLISNPRLRPADKHSHISELGISIASTVDVDPSFREAEWLRNMASNRTKKDSIYLPFPTGIWNAETAMHGPQRALFTLADIDEFVRDDPDAVFTGKLSLLITGVSITDCWRRSMLCCSECCGVPLYANHAQTICKNCGALRPLSLNPRIIGPMVDETGCIATGKLIWSGRAWTELLVGVEEEMSPANDGQNACIGDGITRDTRSSSSWEELTALDLVALRIVEEQLLYSRITLTFGWSPAVDRLCVLGVEW